MGIQAVDIEESKRRIKQAVEWFPGATLPCGRQSGKTTAILEMIHERHHGAAVFFSATPDMAQYARTWYRDRWPEDRQPIFTSDARSLAGQAVPIYVDEAWFVSHKNNETLEDLNHRIVCRLGTRL